MSRAFELRVTDALARLEEKLDRIVERLEGVSPFVDVSAEAEQLPFPLMTSAADIMAAERAAESAERLKTRARARVIGLPENYKGPVTPIAL